MFNCESCAHKPQLCRLIDNAENISNEIEAIKIKYKIGTAYLPFELTARCVAYKEKGYHRPQITFPR